MSKYKFFALTGVAYNFWSCTDSIKYLFAGFSFISLADLLLAGAGLVLCIALIRKKSAALPMTFESPYLHEFEFYPSEDPDDFFLYMAES